MAINNHFLIKSQIVPYMAPALQHLLADLDEPYLEHLEEIRLRVAKPLILKGDNFVVTIDENRRVREDLKRGYLVNEDDIFRTIASISENSLYAFEEEIKRGFITIPGGHRVGLAGQVMAQGSEVRTIKNFSSISFRIARQIPGCSNKLLDSIFASGDEKIKNTLIISPPRCGKTTILRDLARIIATGSHLHQASNVVIIDERSEIAGSYLGVPQLDVGPQTDVLDGCPKAIGIIMAIRALSPAVIITDEIGQRADVEAIRECLGAGVSIICSVHGAGIEELARRPLFKEILELRAFKVGVVLSRRHGPGSIERIIRWD